jgi:hypothetical protein
MRCLAIVMMLAGSACIGSLSADSPSGADDKGSGSGAGGGTECVRDDQCAAVGSKCCDCPTFAVPTSSPAYRACTGVTCPPNDSCPDNVVARCDSGQCKLGCAPMACPQGCPMGFATDGNDGNGNECLTCMCAVPVGGCSLDGDCAETRADCCGCAHGGADTAILKQDLAAFDMSLGCPPDPACPGTDQCTIGAAPRCVQGQCELVMPLPPNACGRFDLPMCPMGEECIVNGPDMNANMQGVGVCMPIGL